MAKLTVIDPVKRQPEKGIEATEMSPMDPPEAYSPPGLDHVSADDLHPFLRRLSEEHVRMGEQLDAIEELLQSVKLNGFTHEADHALMHFLEAFDRDFIPHSREEEVKLFPLLAERLLADGEHSKGAATVTTAVDVMMDEHLKAIQHAAVILNFVRIGTCLPDEKSAAIVIDAGLRETANLVELLRLHMFREDNIVFASAHRLISTAEMDKLESMGAPLSKD